MALRNTKSNVETVDDEMSESQSPPPPPPKNCNYDDDLEEEDPVQSDNENDDEPQSIAKQSPAIARKTPLSSKRKTSSSSSTHTKHQKSNAEVASGELELLNTLQTSIINKRKENRIESAEDLFGRMVGEDLKALPPISKLQARNEIQNILFKYRMTVMQDSLQRKLGSTAMIDNPNDVTCSPNQMGRNVFPSNFGHSFQQNLSPSSSSSSQ